MDEIHFVDFTESLWIEVVKDELTRIHEWNDALSNGIVSDRGREFKKGFRLTLKPMDETYHCTTAFQTSKTRKNHKFQPIYTLISFLSRVCFHSFSIKRMSFSTKELSFMWCKLFSLISNHSDVTGEYNDKKKGRERENISSIIRCLYRASLSKLLEARMVKVHLRFCYRPRPIVSRVLWNEGENFAFTFTSRTENRVHVMGRVIDTESIGERWRGEGFIVAENGTSMCLPMVEKKCRVEFLVNGLRAD